MTFQKGGSVPQIIEALDDRDCPQRPRDFNVEGFWPKVLSVLTTDAREWGCNCYIVTTAGDGLYQVWRNHE